MNEKSHLININSQKESGSDIRDMSIECDNIGGINLSQGVCDMGAPKEVVEGAVKAIEGGLNYYTRFDGIDELRTAIAKKLSKYNGIEADAKKNIIVSAGTTGALFCACLALLKPGDEVIIFEPYYSYHVDTILAVGAKPVFVKTYPPDWKFDAGELGAAVGENTRAIIINTPSNPTGKVFSKEELLQIAKVCEKNDLIVFTDEIYEYFVYDGKKHLSPACLPELSERTVSIFGYSKTFSITGWRVGYAVCNEKWAAKIGKLNDLLYVCSPSPLQAGVAAGIEKLPDSYYEKIRKEHEEKRDMLASALKKAGLEPYVPQGAYYMLADASKVKGEKGREKAMNFLKETGIATVPGRAFYFDGGANILRFCFAKDKKVIEEACKRILKFGGNADGEI
ncbi:aminotransferase [Candidatus Micrarchaeota archaeon CG10_big_fil_rev_8_21_14_0_10_45_29]|nr:MAG: aminotransferase [Candidatus Micrarchaeota archaeon CG10_big_fil_rev_8_21_14_0_10_45_29]